MLCTTAPEATQKLWVTGTVRQYTSDVPAWLTEMHLIVALPLGDVHANACAKANLAALLIAIQARLAGRSLAGCGAILPRRPLSDELNPALFAVECVVLASIGDDESCVASC